jgi:hypothetical protein
MKTKQAVPSGNKFPSQDLGPTTGSSFDFKNDYVTKRIVQVPLVVERSLELVASRKPFFKKLWLRFLKNEKFKS